MLLFVIVTIFVVFITSLFIYARWNYGVLEGMGIPVIHRHFLLGSTHDVGKEVHVEEDIARFKKFGPIYGVYEGRSPQVHICDAELIKSILVTDFDHFDSRRVMDFGTPLMNEIPDFIQDIHKWKLVRQLSSPTMTSAKTKVMGGAMVDTLSDFVENLKASDDKTEKIDLKLKIQAMLTDLVARSFFGIQIHNPDANSDTGNKFAEIIRKVVDGEGEDWSEGTAGGYVESFKLFQASSLSFPILTKFASNFAQDADDLLLSLKNFLLDRLNSGPFVETVLTWLDKANSPEFQKANITETTILCQPTLPFWAAGDQISTVLTHLFYNVVKNPNIERRIYSEIDSIGGGVVDLEKVKDLSYLTACVTEALRLYPVFTRLERMCTKDWVGDHNLRIKKGMTVVVPIWAANRNPEHFSDPETFDPERFMPENKGRIHPYAFMSFGHGPRNCFGQRFATQVMILTAASMLQHFIFKLDPESEKIRYLPGSMFTAYCDPIQFQLIQRN